MAPLFFQIDSNKLRHDVQNGVTLIFAKFGKDLFNISKVIGRKTKWPRFLAYPAAANCYRPTVDVNTVRIQNTCTHNLKSLHYTQRAQSYDSSMSSGYMSYYRLLSRYFIAVQFWQLFRR